MPADEVHYFIVGGDAKMVEVVREDKRSKRVMGHMGSVRSALDLIADDMPRKSEQVQVHIHIWERHAR